MSLNGSHCLIIKIKLKVSSGSVLLYDWPAYFLFFAKLELVNHILGDPWLLSCWLVRYGLMEESLLYLLMCLGNFYQKENPHSFTTPRVCPTKTIWWSSWYKSLHICALLLHWASSNFVTLVRCLSYLFDQDHVHSTSWTSTLEVSYAIPSIHKIKHHV